jgi:hypothetical protein
LLFIVHFEKGICPPDDLSDQFVIEVSKNSKKLQSGTYTARIHLCLAEKD